MKNIAVLFLLLVAQAVSAQLESVGGDWFIERDVDELDDSEIVRLILETSDVQGFSSDVESARLQIDCYEFSGYAYVLVDFPQHEPRAKLDEPIEVIYKIGTDEAVTSEWFLSFFGYWYYVPLQIDLVSGYWDITKFDASMLVEALVQDNSRFIVRADYGRVTATWNIEGLAEVIDECVAVFD